jgi:tRNA threonylcarbamoyl adenosine modification protein YeaZ
MKILAIDTATKSCSVAVTDDGSLSAELTTLKNQTHSKHLMELIHSVLEIAGFGVGDLDGLAVTIGPGSFTGLRIGISTIKGLAHALDKPVVGISSLKALALCLLEPVPSFIAKELQLRWAVWPILFPRAKTLYGHRVLPFLACQDLRPMTPMGLPVWSRITSGNRMRN